MAKVINRTVFGSCSDPDYSKPLPGEVLQWTAYRPVVLRPPPGLTADPWQKRAIAHCARRHTLPPVTVFDGTNPYPRVF